MRSSSSSALICAASAFLAYFSVWMTCMRSLHGKTEIPLSNFGFFGWENVRPPRLVWTVTSRSHRNFAPNHPLKESGDCFDRDDFELVIDLDANVRADAFAIDGR